MGDRIAILKDGDLQQVGTPLEVYASPANMFVASFIGTPPMNLLQAQVASGGDVLEGKGFKLPVAGRLRPLVASRGGDAVVVGIRPETIFASAGEVGGESAAMSVQVEVVEPLGHENIVHAKVGDEFLTATMEPQGSPEVGQAADFYVGLDGLHLFDAKSEANLAS